MDTPHPDPSPPPRLGSRRDLAATLVGGLLLSAVAIACYALFPVPRALEAPENPVEYAGLACWLASILLAGAIVATQKARRDRLNGLWLGALAAAASLRELDIHTRLNPEHLGALGVRYRIDWWLDPTVSALLKSVWAAIFILAAALIVVPPLVVRAPALRLARAGDPATLLFGAAIVFLGLGYVSDDLLRHSPYISKANLYRVEEWFELLGAGAFLGSALHTLRWPLDRRIAAVTRRRAER